MKVRYVFLRFTYFSTFTKTSCLLCTFRWFRTGLVLALSLRIKLLSSLACFCLCRILQKHVAPSPPTVTVGEPIQWPGSGNAMVSNTHTSNDKRSQHQLQPHTDRQEQHTHMLFTTNGSE